ncbi:MAG: flagellin [Rhodocyclaceae bacterium]
MPSVINTNIASLNAQRNLSTSQSALQRSLQRLSSGMRINSAKDDAAGLAVATRMDSIIRGSQVAMRNANDGISLAQTTEDSISKITDSLQRMRELAVQAANATLSSGDRDNLQVEFLQMQDEIHRVISGANFNGVSLLDSGALTFNTAFAFQIGAGASGANVLSVAQDSSNSVNVGDFETNYIGTGVGGGSTVIFIGGTDFVQAQSAIDLLDSALSFVNAARAKWGAVQNRFDAIVSSLQITVENQSAAKSRIMDADFAAETAALTRGQILQQAGTAMLAQANSLPTGVLSLLK